MNSAAFLADPRRYFLGAYEQFRKFGGPCVHFHEECLLAGDVDFLSDRHIEMLYATLTAWGMHRMGDANITKTKLANWDLFRESIRSQATALKPLRNVCLLELSEAEYAQALAELETCYRRLQLTNASATVVVNSKALFHILPRLIPPIDRQYTIRFFNFLPADWRHSNGKFKTIQLPPNIENQLDLFQSICLKIKRLADQVERSLLDCELLNNKVTAPKAIDNAIVNFVRLHSDGQLPEAKFRLRRSMVRH